MKLITCYSNSHEILFKEYFSPSLECHLDVELRVKQLDQISSTGDYGSPGFNKTTQEKIQWLIENIEPGGDDACYSDVDVQFFRNLKYDLGDNDILFQWDVFNYCSGFFIFKQNDRVLNFFKMVEEYIPSVLDDQYAVNVLLNQYPIKYNRLDYNYWTVGNALEGKSQWLGEFFEVPKNIIMHHANFTIGMPNKIKLLDIVKQKVGT